jgi:hypothetical protein
MFATCEDVENVEDVEDVEDGVVGVVLPRIFFCGASAVGAWNCRRLAQQVIGVFRSRSSSTLRVE